MRSVNVGEHIRQLRLGLGMSVRTLRERSRMHTRARTHQTPLLIHSVNISALLLGGVILLLTAVTKPAQLLLLVPVLALLGVYGRCWRHPSVVAGYFGMALAL